MTRQNFYASLLTAVLLIVFLFEAMIGAYGVVFEAVLFDNRSVSLAIESTALFFAGIVHLPATVSILGGTVDRLTRNYVILAAPVSTLMSLIVLLAMPLAHREMWQYRLGCAMTSLTYAPCITLAAVYRKGFLASAILPYTNIN